MKRHYFKVVARVAIDADTEWEAKRKFKEYLEEYLEETEFETFTETYFSIEEALEDWEFPPHDIGEFN